MSRYRAFGIHFGISLVIFLALAWLVVRVWYPGFFFETDGGWEGMRIIVLVDLVLGPLLTLLVFKAGKPGLRFDLTVIGLVQAIALAGGTWVVHAERPLAMVYVDGQFFTVSRGDFEELELETPSLDALPGPYPKWVAVEIPDDPVAQSEIRQRSLSTDTPLRLLADRYVPFEPDPRFFDEAYPRAEIEARDGEKHALARWLASHGGALDDYRFYPLGARYRYAFLGYRAVDGALVGVLDVEAG